MLNDLALHGLIGGKSGGYSIGNIEGFAVDSVDDGTVRLTWKDPNDIVLEGETIAVWGGTVVRRKTGAYPTDEKDGELVVDSNTRNQYETTPYEDIGLTNDIEYFYMAFPYSEQGVYTVDSANRVSAKPTDNDDTSGSPGPVDLVGGTMQEGYFGTVPSNDFISGDALASEIGLSAGTSQHSTVDWLKHAIDDKIIFSPMKSFRYDISWDQIDAADAVYGGKIITIDGLDYKVRLWKGANADPYDYNATDRDAIGSEWNRLMLPINERASDQSWEYPDFVDIPTEDWGVNFTDSDLLTHRDFGDGSYIWGQETTAHDTSWRVIRGYFGVSSSVSNASSGSGASYGWRPVLELVQ